MKNDIQPVKITIDGQKVFVKPELTILMAAQQNGIRIPTLCHHPALTDRGGCRMCIVEVDGAPRLAASCVTPVRDGMEVVTVNDRITETRRIILEFLFAERNHNCMFCPTGALYNRYRTHYAVKGQSKDRHTIRTTCPLCGLLCPTVSTVRDDYLIKIEGLIPAGDDRPEGGQLCHVGRFDVLKNSGRRLLHPMLKKADGSWGEASWESALDMTVERLNAVRDTHGGNAVMGLVSGLSSNEELVCFRDLMVKGWQTGKIATLEKSGFQNIYSAGADNGQAFKEVSWQKIAEADFILVLGTVTPDSRPVLGSMIRKRIIKDNIRSAAIGPGDFPYPYGTHHIQVKNGDELLLIKAVLSEALKGIINSALAAEAGKIFKQTEPVKVPDIIKKLNLAGSGEEALEKLDQNPDVVVLDIKMPGMDGYQVLAEIKKRSPDLQVIMLTGHAALPSAKESRAKGAFDYLTKPCDIEILAAKIEDAYHYGKAPETFEEQRVMGVMVPFQEYTTVSADESIRDAVLKLRASFTSKVSTSRLMETGHRSVLVMDDKDNVEGILAIRDLLELVLPSYLTAPKPSMADSIQYSPMFWQGMFIKEVKQKSEIRIGDVMSPVPLKIEGNASLMEAAYLMVQNNARRLVVEVAGKVVGVIREQDLFFEMEKIIREKFRQKDVFKD
jgi:CheY-like chemotaxis protein/aerobic-type carbon monoxide dehydrogenase small subunit (CoxS/CutS family)